METGEERQNLRVMQKFYEVDAAISAQVDALALKEPGFLDSLEDQIAYNMRLSFLAGQRELINQLMNDLGPT